MLKTTKEFIENAKKVHGDKYDYSNVNYINSKIKVNIICHKHGQFEQTPNDHLNGHGCKKCGIEIATIKNRKKLEDFIKKAKEIHGNRYDYSKVDYINCKTKVNIICSEHGEFFQTPNSHLFGRGCPGCSGTKKLIIEEFIEKARLVHGDRYDYSKVEYVNNGTKVCIICSEHGEFKQTPNSHLNGCGCKKCSKIYSPTTEEFIEKARFIHGDRYNYSKVDYNGANSYISIICPIHGEFKQTPSTHLSSRGCRKCKYENHGEKVRRFKNVEEFIIAAKKVHGDKYDYSKIKEYKNGRNKLTIICSIHGEFQQNSQHHIDRKYGCSFCYKIENLNRINAYNEKKHQFCKENFLKRCLEIHGDLFEYLEEYKSATEKIKIKCNKCGFIFQQKTSNHLQGQGCPNCLASKGEKRIEKYLKDHNIKYEMEYSFNDCRGVRRPLPFDFYIEEHNLLIEYQGEQHYRPTAFNGYEYDVNSSFEKMKKSDKIKKDYCNKNNLPLLEISYNDFNNIEEILNDIFINTYK